MENKKISGILWTILAGLLIFGIGVAIGMYATHPLISISNITITNNSARLTPTGITPTANLKGYYIPNYAGNTTTYSPNLVCIITYNNSVGWSTPYGCVKT